MSLRLRYEKLKNTRQVYQNQLEDKEKELTSLKEKSNNLIKARWVLTKVAEQTQLRFKEKVESLVTMAIQSVFDRNFNFVLLFEQKRNKFECRPVVMENEVEYTPKDDMGGGIIDVISFALRVVLWSLQKPKTRNFLVLDEPMKYVGKGELLERAGMMLREISHRLGIQLVLVTHEPQLAEIADTAYSVTHRSGKSFVELIKGEVKSIAKKRIVKRRK